MRHLTREQTAMLYRASGPDDAGASSPQWRPDGKTPSEALDPDGLWMQREIAKLMSANA